MTFDPNEKRDQYGRWTAGGEADTVTAIGAVNAESVRRYALAATRVAEDLGFDPTKIAVVSEERPKFMLNGVAHDWAGAADLKAGTIELYEPHLDPASVTEVVAHEIGHQKFQRYIDDYTAESRRMNEAEKDTNTRDFMRADGLLKPPYDEKYPLYQEYTRLMMDGISQFAKSDGITPYSREWWKAWESGNAQTPQAMHETIAEMTARAYSLPASQDTEAPKFKAAGYSLDATLGSFKRPTEYKVRKWKGEAIDEATLPPELRTSLDKLRARANYEARFLSGKPSSASRYSEPAPEWAALYDAVQKHWNKT